MNIGETQTTYTKIPEKDAVLLIRALGLLLSQAGIYGPQHNVTQSAARSVFAELEQAIRTFGPIEIALRERQVLVNGSSDGLNVTTGKNLSDRMALHAINGLLFLAPPDLSDFLKCITLFGTQPLELAAEGGFEGAIKKEKLRSVRVVSVAYQRVENGETVTKEPAGERQKPQVLSSAVRRPETVLASGVLDLSSALGGAEEESGSEHNAADGRGDSSALAYKKQSAELATLLREAATLLEGGAGSAGHELSPNVTNALSRIRGILSEMVVGSERQISTLANQVNEDRQTIASIESAARRRGIGLKLMRAELVQRYAELNQEIMQPLTVSTGVIDMLNSGCTGALTDAQRELLKMAAESVDRVNQLVAYMGQISGLPETYTPDATIIRDSYR